jgi:hypothetical protein
MSNSSPATLPEVRNLAMQLPVVDQWALLKMLVEFLQPEMLIDSADPSTVELMTLVQNGKSLDFLSSEPDLYTLADGEPII